jgi:hypothetical protein
MSQLPGLLIKKLYDLQCDIWLIGAAVHASIVREGNHQDFELMKAMAVDEINAAQEAIQRAARLVADFINTK